MSREPAPDQQRTCWAMGHPALRKLGTDEPAELGLWGPARESGWMEQGVLLDLGSQALANTHCLFFWGCLLFIQQILIGHICIAQPSLGLKSPLLGYE